MDQVVSVRHSSILSLRLTFARTPFTQLSANPPRRTNSVVHSCPAFADEHIVGSLFFPYPTDIGPAGITHG